MASVELQTDVFTLEEAAHYLRLLPGQVLDLASRGAIPGRRIGTDWRFLRAALDEWLAEPDPRAVFLSQAGALADDPTLEELRRSIYERRGRPEVENSAGA